MRETSSKPRPFLAAALASLALVVVTAALVATPTDGAAASGSTATGVSIPKLVGQSLMGSFAGTTPSMDFLARIRSGELGGVILFGGNISTIVQLKATIAMLQAAAARGGNPPLLIATDQEGGAVKRLPAGPPTSSAETMGAQDTASAIRNIGGATGLYLKRLGINVDLAPVLDVGNAATSFLGSRIFGSNPATVASLGSRFATGLQSVRVAATAKHFPGLGTAPGNTDTHAILVTSSRQELDRRLAPFRAAVRAGVKLVMVSNASYKTLDPSGLPACLSPSIVGNLLRGQLGFAEVVITDALSAPGPAAYPDAPIRALNAGVDVLLYSNGETASKRVFPLLVNAVRSGALPLVTLQGSDARVQSLKRWLTTT